MYNKCEIQVFKNSKLVNTLKNENYVKVLESLTSDFIDFTNYKLCKLKYIYNEIGKKDIIFTYKDKEYKTVKRYFNI